MSQKHYVEASGLAALAGAAVEISWHLEKNAAFLREPLTLTLAAMGVCAGSFVACLFWAYAALYRPLLRSKPAAAPVAACYAAVTAPLLWTAARTTPSAVPWWLAVAGAVIVAFGVGWALATLLRYRAAKITVTIVAGLALLFVSAHRVLGAAPRAPSPQPDVVLITLTGVRADRIGCYGYEKARTANIDGLARGGTFFKNCVATAPRTALSHASVLTSRYPAPPANYVLTPSPAPRARTLAEELRDAGYNTAAFVASADLAAGVTGFDLGFDVYDDAVSPGTGYRSSPLIPLAVAREFSVLRTDGDVERRTATEVTDAALRWLGTRHPAPFFLWVNYADADAVFAPPSAFVRPGLRGYFFQLRLNDRWKKGPATRASASHVSELYDGEVAYVDAEIGRLLGFLEKKSRRRPVVIIVGDHGQTLGEHAEKRQGYNLYREQIEVPFVISGAPNSPPGAPPVVVSPLDVSPTVLDIVRRRAGDGMIGSSLMRNARGETRAYSFCPGDDGAAGLMAWTTPTEKLILGRDTVELYDLAGDAGELVNVAAGNPERVKALAFELERYRAGLTDD